eukprot:351857-Chlamydomonas_euryale.AAC.1
MSHRSARDGRSSSPTCAVRAQVCVACAAVVGGVALRKGGGAVVRLARHQEGPPLARDAHAASADALPAAALGAAGAGDGAAAWVCARGRRRRDGSDGRCAPDAGQHAAGRGFARHAAYGATALVPVARPGRWRAAGAAAGGPAAIAAV